MKPLGIAGGYFTSRPQQQINPSGALSQLARALCEQVKVCFFSHVGLASFNRLHGPTITSVDPMKFTWQCIESGELESVLSLGRTETT